MKTNMPRLGTAAFAGMLAGQRPLFAAVLCAGLASALWFIYLSFPIAAWVAGDFKVFWTAAQLEQQLAYDFAAVTAALPGETSLRPFLSPPTLLLLMQPFAELPLTAAYLLWTAIGGTLFCAVSWRGSRAAILVLLAAPAFHWAVIAGQVTLLVGGLIYAGAFCVRRRPLAAGFLLAGAALLKPQAALLVPLALVAGGHYRVLLVAFVGGSAAVMTSLALVGPQAWVDWLRAVEAFAELIRVNGFIGKGITPAAFAHDLQAHGAAGTAIVAGGALLGVGACWHIFRRTEDPVLRGGALVCGSLLCTPYALTYEAASLLPAAAALLTRHRGGWAAPVTAALVVCFPFSPLTVAFFAVGLLAHLTREQFEERPAPQLGMAWLAKP